MLQRKPQGHLAPLQLLPPSFTPPQVQPPVTWGMHSSCFSCHCFIVGIPLFPAVLCFWTLEAWIRKKNSYFLLKKTALYQQKALPAVPISLMLFLLCPEARQPFCCAEAQVIRERSPGPHCPQLSLSGIWGLVCTLGQSEGDFHGHSWQLCAIWGYAGIHESLPAQGPPHPVHVPQRRGWGGKENMAAWGGTQSLLLQLGRKSCDSISEVKNAQE